MSFTNLLQFIFTLITIFVITFIPGYFVLRRWDLKEDERIAASFGISFIIFYIIGFILFLLNENSIKPIYPAYIALFSALLYLYRYKTVLFNKSKDCFPDLKTKIKQLLKIENLSLLIIVFIIYLYTAFFESLIRSLYYFYTTGFTGNDWLGFFSESRFFSSNTTAVDVGYLLYRTPLYYIVNGFFLRIFGDSLWVFQIGNSILSAPFFLGLYLLSKKLFASESASSKIGFLMITFIFLNPFFFKNLIYPHSKILVTYFIIMSIYFYLKLRDTGFNGDKKKDFFLFGLFTGAAYMSHQLALLYMVGIAIDYLYLLRCRIIRFSIRTAAVCLIPLIGIIAPYYLWVIGEYGIRTVLSQNPPIFRTTFFFWLYSRLQDLFTSFVPVELIYYVYAAVIGISKSFDKLFDSTMSFYVHTVLGAFTLTVTAFLFYRIITDRTKIKTRINYIFKNLKIYLSSTSDHNALMGILIFTGFIGGLLVIPAFFLANHGIAMASLVPMIALLLMYLVKYAYDSPLSLRSLLFLGISAEFLITTWSQFLITYFGLKVLPIPSEKSNLLIYSFVSGNVFLGDYWIISLIVVILIQLFFMANLYRLFVKGSVAY